MLSTHSYDEVTLQQNIQSTVSESNNDDDVTPIPTRTTNCSMCKKSFTKKAIINDPYCVDCKNIANEAMMEAIKCFNDDLPEKSQECPAMQGDKINAAVEQQAEDAEEAENDKQGGNEKDDAIQQEAEKEVEDEEVGKISAAANQSMPSDLSLTNLDSNEYDDSERSLEVIVVVLQFNYLYSFILFSNIKLLEKCSSPVCLIR